jgi:RIO kinase 1
MRPTPDWLVDEPHHDVDLGVIKSGKVAQLNLIERTGGDGRHALLARTRYLPREV